MDAQFEQQWYALQVRTRFARPAAQTIDRKGFEVFLPTYGQTTKWSDRYSRIELPLFPGYLFCRFSPQERLLPILTSPGVISIVRAGAIPVPIPDDEINAIKALVRSGLPVAPYPELVKGARVLIEKGPLAGVEGVIVTTGKSCRLIVSVELLQRSVMAEIDREWARPAKVTPIRKASPFHRVMPLPAA